MYEHVLFLYNFLKKNKKKNDNSIFLDLAKY